MALVVLVVPQGQSQTSKSNADPDLPHFSVEVWGDVVVDFRARIRPILNFAASWKKDYPFKR